MIIISTLSILISNAVTLRRDMAILFNRVAIMSLFYCILQSFVCFSISSQGIGLHGGLFHVTTITQIFHIFFYIICIFIIFLGTGILPPHGVKDLDALTEWLEKLLMMGLINLAFYYYLLGLILAGIIIISDIIKPKIEIRRPVPEMDIIPNTVRDGNQIYPGVIDLLDPQGFYLRILYQGVRNVKFVYIDCHVSGEVFLCVRSTTPLNPFYRGYLPWPVNTWFMHNEGDQYITTIFPAFNPVAWNILRQQLGLRIMTGYDDCAIEIVPNWINYFFIMPRGRASIFHDTVRAL